VGKGVRRAPVQLLIEPRMNFFLERAKAGNAFRTAPSRSGGQAITSSIVPCGSVRGQKARSLKRTCRRLEGISVTPAPASTSASTLERTFDVWRILGENPACSQSGVILSKRTGEISRSQSTKDSFASSAAPADDALERDRRAAGDERNEIECFGAEPRSVRRLELPREASIQRAAEQGL
jgi:hypothetical protein